MNLFSCEGNLNCHQIFFSLLFLVVLGLGCCTLLSPVAAPRLLPEVASLAERGLCFLQLQRPGSCLKWLLVAERGLCFLQLRRPGSSLKWLLVAERGLCFLQLRRPGSSLKWLLVAERGL